MKSIWMMGIIFFICLSVGISGDDGEAISVYYKNFVRHSEGEFCEHVPPLTSFVVYVNNTDDRILVENAPRWETNADPNINGLGVFGVELGNFSQPSLQVGDSVFIRFICQETGQQGTLRSRVSGIPWYYFPTTLTLQPAAFPPKPSHIELAFTARGFREIRWNASAGVAYRVYRRLLPDTVVGGRPRMLYWKVAEGVRSGSWVDSLVGGPGHGYLVIPVRDGVFGPHSDEVVDFPPAPEQVEAAVSGEDPLTLAVTYQYPADTSGISFRIYRSRNSSVPIDSAHYLGQTENTFFLDTTVVRGERYFYRVTALNFYHIEGHPSPVAEVVAEPFAGGLPDLDVLYISRTPRYPRFQVEYGPPPGYNPHLKPGTEHLQHYPRHGEPLTYTAVIRNSGGGEAGEFRVEWWVDSVLVQTESFPPLFPRQRVYSSLLWPYDSTRGQMIECKVIPLESYQEVSFENNRVQIRSNALSFHFYVEESLRELFENTPNPLGSYSFEDWAQVQLAQMRCFFRQAVYPTTTSRGVTEFVYLDTVSYYPDGTLPDYGTHALPSELWDGQWGFTGDAEALNYFRNVVIGQNEGMDWALLHELGHQLGLIDLYNMDVQESELQVIEPRTGQKPPLRPVRWDVLYYCSRNAFLMHSNFQAGFSDHSAGALQRNRGKRRGFFGEYLADVPRENAFLIQYPNGTAVKNADVWVYQMQDNVIPNVPKFRGRTDKSGQYQFPHVTDTLYAGGISVAHPFSTVYSEHPQVVGTNAVLFVRVAKGDSVGYRFIDICDFNVAYWSGDSLAAVYPLKVTDWFILPATGVDEEPRNAMTRTALVGNYPNPFNGSTRILFRLAQAGRVRLEIFDLRGSRVVTLADRFFSGGEHTVTWNGKDARNRQVPSGIYVLRLEGGGKVAFRKLLFLK